MKSGLLSIVITISMMYGFLTVLKIWLPTIISHDTFFKLGASVLIIDILLISLWAILRNARDDDDFKKGNYTN